MQPPPPVMAAPTGEVPVRVFATEVAACLDRDPFLTRDSLLADLWQRADPTGFRQAAADLSGVPPPRPTPREVGTAMETAMVSGASPAGKPCLRGATLQWVAAADGTVFSGSLTPAGLAPRASAVDTGPYTISGTPDGLVIGDGTPTIVVEAKTSRFPTLLYAPTPRDLVQVQTYLALSGAPAATLVYLQQHSLPQQGTPRTFAIARDDAFWMGEAIPAVEAVVGAVRALMRGLASRESVAAVVAAARAPGCCP